MKSYIVATCVDYSYKLKQPKLLFFYVLRKDNTKREGVSMQESPVNLKLSSVFQTQGSPWVNIRGNL